MRELNSRLDHFVGMATELAVGGSNVLSELAIVGGTDFFSATLKSLVVILVTEIGDKTFFIAAV